MSSSVTETTHTPPAIAHGKHSDIVSTVVTTAVWTAIGAVAGRIIGSVGDIKTRGIGTRVGTIVGALTGGGIALGSILKREMNDPTSRHYKPEMPANSSPEVTVANPAHEGTLVALSQEIQK